MQQLNKPTVIRSPGNDRRTGVAAFEQGFPAVHPKTAKRRRHLGTVTSKAAVDEHRPNLGFKERGGRGGQSWGLRPQRRSEGDAHADRKADARKIPGKMIGHQTVLVSDVVRPNTGDR